MSKNIRWRDSISVWETTPNIIAAWAFGSAQGGNVRDNGDVDIGILTNAAMSLDEQLHLLGQLQSALQFEDIDLVILNDANPMLRFEAVCGRRLYCRDAGAMAEFVSLTAREYEDEMAQWQYALQKYATIRK